MINLGVFNYSAVFGGQEKYLALMAAELAGRDVRMVFLGGPELLVEMFRRYGASVNEEALSTDVVLLNGNRALYESFCHRKTADCIVYVQHSSFADRQAGWWRCMMRSLLLRVALRHVDAVIRVSDSAIPDGWCGRKILRTVYNGVDLSRFPCKSSWSDLRRPLKLLMVGAVNDNKNQRLAIAVLAHLPEAVLTIVGEGPLQSELQALAESLGVAHRVRWAGLHADPAAFYREADVYLMLSHFEAMPFVVREAMASGTPVVGFAVGGVAEVVQHEVNGCLMTERTPAALAAVLTELEQQPDRLAQMGQAARARIESKFTVQHMVQGFLDVVAEVLQRKGLQSFRDVERT